MNTNIKESEYAKLDFSKIMFSDIITPLEEALQDVEPIKWSEDVLLGKKKVTISK